MSEHNIGTPKKITKHLSPVRISKSSGVNQRGFVPPVLQEVGKLAAGVAAVATGSSTAIRVTFSERHLFRNDEDN
ncbi:hypothetical protein FQR65_LT01895 [Abscondita terminalis]|nr:hypothetical protein FQR65_LT01895 [Abscondita terminalis]